MHAYANLTMRKFRNLLVPGYLLWNSLNETDLVELKGLSKIACYI